MVCMRSDKPICAPPRLSEVSPTLPLKRFQCHSFRLALPFQCLSPPRDRWCDVLGFVPTGSVSSFSTLQIFQEASHLCGLLCPPVCLSFPFTPACPGQYTHRSFRRWMSIIDTVHSGLPIPCCVFIPETHTWSGQSVLSHV